MSTSLSNKREPDYGDYRQDGFILQNFVRQGLRGSRD